MFAFDAGDSHFANHNLDVGLVSATSTTTCDILKRGLRGRVEDEEPESTVPSEHETDDIKSVPRPETPMSRLTPESTETIVSGTGTPPIDILLTPSAMRSRSRAREEKAEEEATLPEPTFRPLPQVGKNARRKKRGPKRGGAMAALNAVRGFTPATSGDEDSDFSTGSFRSRRDLSVQRSSSVVRKDLNIRDLGSSCTGNGPDVRSSSPSGGISNLTRQLEALDCESPSGRPSMIGNKSKLSSGDPSSASVTSATSGDEEIVEMTSYEVPLEHDFISPDVSLVEKRGARQDPLLNGGIVRKMQAADFEPLRCLGKGTYGTVLLVKQAATGKLYAQKQFRKASLTVRKQLVEQTKTERSILESINRHPFVVKLFYAFQDHEKLYLILEYAQGGELFEHLRLQGMFQEDTAAFYLAELVLALEHLHSTVGVVYRDLKPENCLLDAEGHLLLTDFGLSKVAVDGEHHCRSMTGTVEYMAPEVIQMQDYGTAVDWWSLGILGVDLLSGKTPFAANNDQKIRDKIVKSKLTLPFFFGPDARDLLTRLLRKEPKKRLGACMPKDMKTIKNHRFFRKIDWKKLEMREVEPPIKPLITDPALAENFSTEFTDLAVSPVVAGPWDAAGSKGEHDPFGGFSFVGSRSLLESSVF